MQLTPTPVLDPESGWISGYILNSLARQRVIILVFPPKRDNTDYAQIQQVSL